MTEILITMAYVVGAIALGLLIELPIYSSIASVRERYQSTVEAINKAQQGLV